MSDFENAKELLGWDDEITTEGFPMIPDSDYDFTVVNFERDRFAGNEKAPACNKANITIRINHQGKDVDIKHSFFMLKKNEWQLSQFFCCIGQKKYGEPLRMNWNTVIGSKGRCKIGKRTYNGNEYNEVKKFIEPAEAKQTTFSDGGF